MLMLYFALIDSEADQLRFSDIYSNYQKQMLLVAKRILQTVKNAISVKVCREPLKISTA